MPLNLTNKLNSACQLEILLGFFSHLDATPQALYHVNIQNFETDLWNTEFRTLNLEHFTVEIVKVPADYTVSSTGGGMGLGT